MAGEYLRLSAEHRINNILFEGWLDEIIYPE